MTIPEFSLLAFAVWTIVVPLGAVGLYRWSRILTGSAAVNAFTADATTGAGWYQRAMRAHANCVENLPVFGSIVGVASILGVTSSTMDALSLTVIIARVAQSSVHMGLVQSARVVSVRFSLFFVQFVCFVALAVHVLMATGVHRAP